MKKTVAEIKASLNIRRVRAAFKRVGKRPVRGQTVAWMWRGDEKRCGPSCCLLAAFDGGEDHDKGALNLGLTGAQRKAVVAGWDAEDRPRAGLQRYVWDLAEKLKAQRA